MTDDRITIDGAVHLVMRRHKNSINSLCSVCSFNTEKLKCPVGTTSERSLLCVDMDTHEEDTFFVLDTPEGRADYISKKLEGK